MRRMLPSIRDDQAASGAHFRPSQINAFARTTSLLMTPVTATLHGFPARTSSSDLPRTEWLCCIGQSVGVNRACRTECLSPCILTSESPSIKGRTITSRFSRSDALNFLATLVAMPARSPRSTSVFLTYSFSVCGAQPIFEEIDRSAYQRLSFCTALLRTMLTAHSRAGANTCSLPCS